MFARRVLLQPVCCFALMGVLGCSQGFVASTGTPVQVTGNWQFSSTAQAAGSLPSLSGALSGSGAAIRGILHADTSPSCVPAATLFPVSGAADATNELILTGSSVAGETLTATGTLAADGRSLSDASYTVTGGACGHPAAVHAMAQMYTPISGTFSGTFSDAAGPVIAIAAALTQTPQSDTSGNFQLSGTATFGANACFGSPATVTNSQVTGGSFTLTYTDPSVLNSVTASGTFSTDGTTLTVTSWSLFGPCGTDAGTGLLIRQ